MHGESGGVVVLLSMLEAHHVLRSVRAAVGLLRRGLFCWIPGLAWALGTIHCSVIGQPTRELTLAA